VICIKCYSLVIDQKLVKEIDKLIEEYGLFSSRSDFIRDAIRARLIEVKKSIIGEENEEKPESKKEREKEEKAVEQAMKELDEHKYGGVH
jgi:Arc/MetJ-type ribon-helix-helix transcriptional regulator